MRPPPTDHRWPRGALVLLAGMLLPGCGFLASRIDVKTTAPPQPEVIAPEGLPQLEELPGGATVASSSATTLPVRPGGGTSTTTTPRDPLDPSTPDPGLVNFAAGLDPSTMSPECGANYRVWTAVVDLARLATYTEFDEATFITAMDRVSAALEIAQPLAPAADRYLVTGLAQDFADATARIRAAGSRRNASAIFTELLAEKEQRVVELTQAAGRQCPRLIAVG
ncbi:MAG: hypothetical protein JWM47_1566 [Acidimicrobiales bacterium]|nr:hypothetical protein [Acidimicrobiales bacterium]